jgi:recombination protein RecA
VAVDLSIVKKSGAWYTYEGEQLGQGRENAKTFLTDAPELMVEISERIRTTVGIGATDGEPEVELDPDMSVADLLDDEVSEPG